MTVKLHGRVILKGEIHVLTGLHIGGSPGALEIGGLDLPVIRDARGFPYIPGSSLKGKMRSLWEKWNNAPQNWPIGKGVKIHVCEKADAYQQCEVCPIYGVPGQLEASAPTRLTARDVPLDPASLEGATTDLPYTEVKWEAAIDRVTSAATPRQIERVPAGAVFRQPKADGKEAGPIEFLVFSFYEPEDVDRFGDVLTALQLVEDDYLGGQGSRGSGKVAFRHLQLVCKGPDYDHPVALPDGEDFDTLQDLLAEKQSVLEKVREVIFSQGG